METGKREEQLAEAAADRSYPSRRLFVTDSVSGRRFLIDTGSDLCCYPRNYLKSHHTVTDYDVRAANGSAIKTYGIINLRLNFGLRRDFRWNFVISDVSTPIIGADFLSHYNLLPDCHKQRLVDGSTKLSIPVSISNCNQVSIKTIAVDSPYAKILLDFPNITRPPGLPRTVNHSTVHHIITTEGPPVSCRPRRLAPQKLLAAKMEFEEMVRCGSARPSSSSWSSPLHMARKGENGWRPCGDYRALNARTIPDRYPVRHVADFSHNLAGTNIYSKIDLIKAYQQIPVSESDICKTAITTPFGLFEFPFMTFGLRNAGQTFQRFMDEVVKGLDFCYPYVDDILVFSHDADEHAQHLKALFQRLSEYGVVLNPSKCVLGVQELTFLGYQISKDGTRPPPERIEALRSFPLPKTIEGLRRFLGMINFYRRFLPNAAELQAPLIDALTSVKLKGAKPFPWTPELEVAFQKCKEHLANAALLVHPVVEAPLGLFTDASSHQIGACLQQFVDGHWRPLAFFSKKLTSKQSDWPAYYRELLAVYESIQHFRHILEVEHVTIYTDHKPLIYAFSQKREKLPPVQLNQLAFISQFTTDIKHVKGAENIVADTMSRVETIHLQDDYAALAKDQALDEELQKAKSDSSLKLEKVRIPGTDLDIICDLSTGKPRPFLTPSFRKSYFKKLHNLTHPGALASTRLVADRFVWPNMRKDCREWARNCLACQRCKISRHTRSPHGTFSSPTKRFHHIHLDIIGPLPPSQNFRYCLTAVDRFTRWPEAWPMIGITAEEVAETFHREWIPRFGVPSLVTTDQGRQFESQLFQSLMQMCSAKRIRTSAYHPCANGLVERMHRQLKAALMCHATSWHKVLPVVLLGMRSALKEDLQCSPAELVYGEPLRLPGEFITQSGNPSLSEDTSSLVTQLKHFMSNLQPTPASRHGPQKSVFVSKTLESSSHVFLRDDSVRPSLKPPYSGPYKVVSRGDKTITITIGSKNVTVSIDRLKPAFMDADSPLPFSRTSRSLDPDVVSSPDDTDANTSVSASPASPSEPPGITTRSGRRVQFRYPCVI